MPFDRLQRREFITLLGGAAAAWPLAARAQQPAMPVVGFLRSTSPPELAHLVAAFRQGLNEAGFVEGQNVAIEYRWADDQSIDCRHWRRIWFAGRWPCSSRRQRRRRSRPRPPPRPFRSSSPSAAIRSQLGSSPASIGRAAMSPGVTFFDGGLAAKRLELLRELVPKAAMIGMLVNPNNPRHEVGAKRRAGGGAAARAATHRDRCQQRPRLRGRLRNLAPSAGPARCSSAATRSSTHLGEQRRSRWRRATRCRRSIPLREFAEAGGLMSYGTEH